MIKQFVETFRPPSAAQLAHRELEDAQRGFLEAKSQQEYATRMAQYHSDRVDRLTTYTRELSK